MKKLVIFDVDGVLLDLWPSMRSVFADYHKMSLSDEDWDDIIIDFLHDPKPYAEFGKYFHTTETFRSLLPIKGMPELVFELRNRCFDLAIVSSSDPNFTQQRCKNLEEHYEDCFEKVICIGMEQTKEKALGQAAEGYDEVFFIDDNPYHLFSSIGIVTTPIWKENEHHRFIWENIYPCGSVKTAKSVDDIRRIILHKN